MSYRVATGVNASACESWFDVNKDALKCLPLCTYAGPVEPQEMIDAGEADDGGRAAIGGPPRLLVFADLTYLLQLRLSRGHHYTL